MSETLPTFNTLQEAWDFAVTDPTIRDQANAGKCPTLVIRESTMSLAAFHSSMKYALTKREFVYKEKPMNKSALLASSNLTN